MGYTHYWQRSLLINPTTYFRIVEDFRTLLHTLRVTEVHLAGPSGSGSPVLRYNNVAFNGKSLCGHPARTLGVAWPAENASGVHVDPETDPVVGRWMGGAQLASRCCDGNCSHEAFEFPRGEIPDSRPTPGGCFRFCKTAYKPYDLAVCVFLVITKHHLRDSLRVYSDGTQHHFRDAMQLCDTHLRYGESFLLDVEGE